MANVVERTLARHASRNRNEAGPTVDANLNAGRMRRTLPWIVLVLTAFVVAELLPGSAPITEPGLWPFLHLIYGPGALLIRELVRRRDRGWESILLFAAAYGFVEEGLALQSLFNPTLHGAADWGARIHGFNGVYAETALTIHAVWTPLSQFCSRTCCSPIARYAVLGASSPPPESTMGFPTNRVGAT